ncbi:hypothetical protein AGOR_G00150620 [Albula goreensis]|uniref:EF-hand calcium-binding domain-containing protein 7 n=1 Tax=Albula goreensis TaxID=1534307 RepID=A0A8T3D3C2_9TELE|nr:hypothetical protein AGOR_G00150620 [Albula goreensis]
MQKSQCTEEETFYMNCRAAYLAVLKSSLVNITSKEQLCLVLQQAGRNPSQKTLKKYWTPRTTKLNFDDFCEILRKEKPTEENELMKAFRKLDINGHGYISHSDLYKVLTSRGEKMSPEEMNEIFSLSDWKMDEKLDYAKFCRLLVSTAEQCQTIAMEKLESDTKLKRQNFGNQAVITPKDPKSQAVPSVPEAPRTPSQMPHRGKVRTSLEPLSNRMSIETVNP